MLANSESTRSWWTVFELAEHYGISSRCIYQAVATGALTAHRFGAGRGAIRIHEADRIEWEQGCRRQKAARAAEPARAVVATSLVRKHFRLQ